MLMSIISFHSFSQNYNALRIKIIGNGYSDETIIRLKSDGHTSFDASYDAWKLFSPNPNVPSIYTQIAVNQELAINTLPEFTNDTDVVVYTNIPATDNYTVIVEEIFPLDANYKISLTDISTNTHYTILSDTSFNFNLTPQQLQATFKLNISSPINISNVDEVCYGMNNGGITVNNPGNNDWNMEIIDNSFNTIYNSQSNTETFSFSSLSPDDYTVIVTSKGITDQETFTIDPAPILNANFNLENDTVYLDNGGLVEINDASLNATDYLWDFSDGNTINNTSNPAYNYTTLGDYDITLTVTNGSLCSDQFNKSVTVLQSPSISTSVNEELTEEAIKVQSSNNNIYNIISKNDQLKSLEVYNLSGKLILKDQFSQKDFQFNMSEYNSGIYIVSVRLQDKAFVNKIFR